MVLDHCGFGLIYGAVGRGCLFGGLLVVRIISMWELGFGRVISICRIM
jgi:hypothetical protein